MTTILPLVLTVCSKRHMSGPGVHELSSQFVKVGCIPAASMNTLFHFLSVQFSHSVFAIPWIAAHQASLSITNSQSSFRLTSIESVIPSSHLILCRPLLLLPSIFQGLFQCVSSLHQVTKVLEFQLQYHSLQRNPRADLLQNGLVGSPCSPRDSQESSPTPQFKSINFLFWGSPIYLFCLLLLALLHQV